MKNRFLALAVVALFAPAAKAFASEPADASAKIEKPSHFKFYGFIRNYFAFDSRESKSGTKDLFYYIPKDEALNAKGEDMNANPTFRFLAITSRVGLDVKDYQFGKTKVGAKIETDFYCMNGNVAVLRLRQAYATLGWDGLGKDGKQSTSLKIGQAWHPIAADQPYVIDLETGTPFNPFSRTPQVMLDHNFSKNFTLTGGFIWQMQYLSSGPNGASDNYIKYGCIPEFYAGVTFKSNNGFTGRVGMDMLSIKPRWRNSDGDKVDDRITTVSPYVYAQYSKDAFAVNAKVVYASAGEHFNMLSGYGVTDVNSDGSWDYAPLHSTASYLSVKYGRKLQVQGMIGHMKNLGTSKSLYEDHANPGYTSTKNVYISGNGFHNLNQIIRVTPTVVYNLGKLSFGLEYDITSAQYGKYAVDGHVNSSNGLVDGDLHWVTNHRLLGMVKFTF
uniref:hypothetical protein n=1 Tax=Candidatus Cryptobacteroides bacterium TaxID=3085639 RepID=UPI003FEDB7C9